MNVFEKRQDLGKIAPVEALDGLRILVVDDNPTNRRILLGMLTVWGVEPTCVAGAMEGLSELVSALTTGKPYALVLTDLHMPEIDGFQLVANMRKNPELLPVTVIMLTSAGHRGDVERCRTLGILSYLYKPVRKRELLAALLSALGLRPEVVPRVGVLQPEPGTPASNLHVLLAEDNRVNQIVATRMLEKMGHSVVVADNGLFVLALLATGQFDLVLMDVQMPEMDGLTATRRIRESEQLTRRHMPIIAMTAHAMRGDRERCLEAGMDGYVTKPVVRQRLEEAIAETLPLGAEVRKSEGEKATALGAIEPDPVEWDVEQTKDRLGGDEKLFQEVIAIFLSEVPQHLADLHQAIVRGDVKAVEDIAHTLKGEVGYLGIALITQQLRELEELGKRSDLARAEDIHSKLDAELSVVLSTMHRIAGSGTQLMAGAPGANQ